MDVELEQETAYHNSVTPFCVILQQSLSNDLYGSNLMAVSEVVKSVRDQTAHIRQMRAAGPDSHVNITQGDLCRYILITCTRVSSGRHVLEQQLTINLCYRGLGYDNNFTVQSCDSAQQAGQLANQPACGPDSKSPEKRGKRRLSIMSGNFSTFSLPMNVLKDVQ